MSSLLKKDRLHYLSAYRDRNDVFISFTELEKLGINPQYPPFENPTAIYAYPVKAVWHRLENLNLPWSSRENIWLIKSKSPIIDSNLMTQADVSSYKSKLKDFIRKYVLDNKIVEKDKKDVSRETLIWYAHASLMDINRFMHVHKMHDSFIEKYFDENFLGFCFDPDDDEMGGPRYWKNKNFSLSKSTDLLYIDFLEIQMKDLKDYIDKNYDGVFINDPSKNIHFIYTYWTFYDELKSIINKKVPSKKPTAFAEKIVKSVDKTPKRLKTPFSILNYSVMWAAESIAEATTGSYNALMNTMYRAMGINVLTDDQDGGLLGLESSQTIFFDRASIEVIECLPNKVLGTVSADTKTLFEIYDDLIKSQTNVEILKNLIAFLTYMAKYPDKGTVGEFLSSDKLDKVNELYSKITDAEKIALPEKNKTSLANAYKFFQRGIEA